MSLTRAADLKTRLLRIKQASTHSIQTWSNGLIVALLLSLLSGCANEGARIDNSKSEATKIKDTSSVSPNSKAQAHLNYHDVPAPNFDSIEDIKARKKVFFDYFYPLVVVANDDVISEKVVLKNISNKVLLAITDADRLIVNKLCKKYKVSCKDHAAQENAQKIHTKIGIVPPSLALAQAANESGWGRSRFAVTGNNYFGEWCYTRGCGIPPRNKASDKTHEIRKFASPLQSVKSYVHNLNTAKSYKTLRSIRRSHDLTTAPLSGMTLATGLTRYSSRGEAYIHEIQSMIKVNKLALLDEKYWDENIKPRR